MNCLIVRMPSGRQIVFPCKYVSRVCDVFECGGCKVLAIVRERSAFCVVFDVEVKKEVRDDD
jgi:hypothetical protein